MKQLMLLFLFYLTSFQIAGQVIISDEEKVDIKRQVRESFWLLDEAIYNRKIPEKWHNESSVILDYRNESEYYKKSNKNLYYSNYSP